jgi:hypothetical protein
MHGLIAATRSLCRVQSDSLGYDPRDRAATHLCYGHNMECRFVQVLLLSSIALTVFVAACMSVMHSPFDGLEKERISAVHGGTPFEPMAVFHSARSAGPQMAPSATSLRVWHHRSSAAVVGISNLSSDVAPWNRHAGSRLRI